MSKLCVQLWEVASKLTNQAQGKYNCQDLYIIESEIANYANQKTIIRLSPNGRGVFG